MGAVSKILISRRTMSSSADEAGVDVIYCVEQFGLSNTIGNNILKHMKRIMAAEYSRDLSAKVWRAHLNWLRKASGKVVWCPTAFVGFLVDADGTPKMILEHGQRKAITTERVVVVNGPMLEVEIVRKIFKWYVNEELSFHKIVRNLIP